MFPPVVSAPPCKWPQSCFFNHPGLLGSLDVCLITQLVAGIVSQGDGLGEDCHGWVGGADKWGGGRAKALMSCLDFSSSYKCAMVVMNALTAALMPLMGKRRLLKKALIDVTIIPQMSKAPYNLSVPYLLLTKLNIEKERRTLLDNI